MSDGDEGSLVSIKVLVDGSPLKDMYEITELHVRKALNRIPSATIQIRDGNAAKEDFPLSESSDVVPGKEIDIQAGFGLTTKSIFKGIIVSQRIEIMPDSGPYLNLECRDKALKMTNGRKSGAFAEKKDSEVMSTIVSRNGLSATVDATKVKMGQLVQYYSTDWDFLISRADVNGMVVVASDNKVTVGAPKVSEGPVATLTFGDDIFELENKLSSADQLQAVKAQSWDFKQQKMSSATAAKPSVPAQGNIKGDKIASAASPKTVNLATTANLDTGSLAAWANSQLQKSRLSLIQGKLRVFGDDALLPNTVVELKGLGDRYNGKAYVSGIEHEIKNGNWFTIISTGTDPHWFAEEVEATYPPAAGLLPGIHGLQNATVKAITEDPDGETRIQVSVPTMAVDGEKGELWARWLQPYATSGAGHFFMPEIGDEVIIGFLNEDPRYPVILGSVYSSKKKPPLNPADGNPKKAIVSKEKIQVEFDDKDKVLTLETPGKNTMVFSDKGKSITITDQHKNEIKMEAGGITVTSKKDLTMKATGKVLIQGNGITIDSKMAAEIKAATDFKAQGLSAKLSGQTTFEASGGAQTKVTSGGILTVQGALVKIN